MLLTHLRALWAAYLLRWQAGGESPAAAVNAEQPHWYELPYWC